MKLNSDFFFSEEDIFLCGLYIPPSNYYKKQDVNLFDQLKSNLVKYSSKGQITIIGDLNSRLGFFIICEVEEIIYNAGAVFILMELCSSTCSWIFINCFYSDQNKEMLYNDSKNYKHFIDFLYR